MNDFLKWGQFGFTGLAGSLAAVAPIFPHPSISAVLTAAAACAAIWGGLCQHPPWAAQRNAMPIGEK